MDLTRQFPKSPKETLEGIVHIPRMLDKAKAHNRNKLGDYLFPCPLDDVILRFLGLSAEEFARNVESEDPYKLVAEKINNRSFEDKKAVNRNILERKPDTEEKRQKFNKMRDEINPSRQDIQTWVELIDLEEGRME